jgi:ribonuclease R
MPDYEKLVLATLARKDYKPLKAKALARRLGVTDAVYPEFRQVLRALIKQGKIQFGSQHTILPAGAQHVVTGIYKRFPSGVGIVRTAALAGHASLEYFIAAHHALDAISGDEVLVRVTRKPSGGSQGHGQITEIVKRATEQFVGTYFERDGSALVRVDGTVFTRSIDVGDPGAKGAQPDDKVVIELLRFPTLDERGEGVIIEVLGKRGDPKVDQLAVVRALGIPDTFPEEVLAEARAVAAKFDENDLDGRQDFTDQNVVTIDPVDARDFDDAVNVEVDPKTKHWLLTVHIADVAHFTALGGHLDREARKRGTSVYLPQQVIPMFPEIISNGLASLQEGKLRYVKTAQIEFTAKGQVVGARFANGAIRVRKRFAYEQVSEILKEPEGTAAKALDPPVHALLLRMRELAMILRQRRFKRGSLELSMPEAILEYDKAGHVTGAHFAINDVSHQIIEEFMLAANEAVASHLAEKTIPFLRRIHPAPDPLKLNAFADFAKILGYKMERNADRFELQRILDASLNKPEQHAIHYALLRSLKQAVYSPHQEDHYALASHHYCHFTSPIRRYPDLQVHRQLGQWIKTGRAGGDADELAALGEHCSRTERRSDNAEREIIKLRLLNYLSERIGMTMDAVITGVAEYGFYAQGQVFPAEGLVHVSSLTDDYYHFDEMSHTLEGKRSRRRYRLGDRVKVEVVRVDLNRRLLDLRVCDQKAPVVEERKGQKREPDKRVVKKRRKQN